MLISHRKKFIYTKTAKTAGTTVESYFEKYCMPEGDWKFAHGREHESISKAGIIGYRGGKANKEGNEWYNHMPANQIRDKIGVATWDEYFKFCVVRNPYDKLISAFFFFNRDNIRDDDVIHSFRSWLKGKINKRITDRNKYVIDEEICVDYFIRYEDLENGIKHICSVINVPFEKENIRNLKSGLRKKVLIRDFYDEQTIQIVKRIYGFELETFNYSMPE